MIRSVVDGGLPRKVVVGVGGGIAAYKVASLVRSLAELGHDVTVVPTAAALEFVGAPTWAALSGKPASADPFDNVHRVPHVRIGKEADLVLVAPATANLLAKVAHGLADDLLTNTLLTATCPIVLAPAMHTEMWLHPATRQNVATLRERGAHVLEPAIGRLTGSDTGPGRLPEPGAILAAALSVLSAGDRGHDFAGKKVVISAGGTREALDPVRFLGNRSTGRQGFALADAAAVRGADVTLVAANSDLRDPPGVDVIQVESAEQMAEQMTLAAGEADVLVMAAAVADFRPNQAAVNKVKKRSDGSVDPLQLIQNPDILAGLVQHRRPGQVVVGFAAETGDDHGTVLEHGRAKLARKGCDLLVVNEVGVGKGFGTEHNTVTLLSGDRDDVDVPTANKVDVAHHILDAVLELLP